MNTIRPRINPYKELANAIILQAVKDYRKLWNFSKEHQAKQDIIRFFYSQWFAILSKLDPDYLIEGLEREANAQRNRHCR